MKWITKVFLGYSRKKALRQFNNLFDYEMRKRFGISYEHCRFLFDKLYNESEAESRKLDIPVFAAVVSCVMAAFSILDHKQCTSIVLAVFLQLHC